MAQSLSEMYNLVILAATPLERGEQHFILSATRLDRADRLVSTAWPGTKVRTCLRAAGLTSVQAEELLRGNRMAHGGRDTRVLTFSREQLLGLGLAEPVAEIASA